MRSLFCRTSTPYLNTFWTYRFHKTKKVRCEVWLPSSLYKRRQYFCCSWSIGNLPHLFGSKHMVFKKFRNIIQFLCSHLRKQYLRNCGLFRNTTHYIGAQKWDSVLRCIFNKQKNISAIFPILVKSTYLLI